MEAPEKLYFEANDDKSVLDIYSIKESDNEIEYIRTDAFIKKVRRWFKDCTTLFTDMNSKKRVDKEMYKTVVEDFEKYME